ncbi:hypothetical protein Trydic_g5201 [Trypoxylus dichotomus]
MDFFSVIIMVIAILIFISLCTACCKSYHTKQVIVRQAGDPNGSIYVTEATVVPGQYPSNTTYLTMPQPMSQFSTSQPLHPAGLGWQIPPYTQADSPPSYEEVVSRSATTTQQQLPETYPKQTTTNNVS